MIDLIATALLNSNLQKGSNPEVVANSGCTVATYYDSGHTTANGESFDPSRLEAAHPWRSFGSYVTLRNPSNGQSVTVRVNDRNPDHEGFDLTPAAFEQLAPLAKGVITVCVE